LICCSKRAAFSTSSLLAGICPLAQFEHNMDP
jgi:hypothetical protein